MLLFQRRFKLLFGCCEIKLASLVSCVYLYIFESLKVSLDFLLQVLYLFMQVSLCALKMFTSSWQYKLTCGKRFFLRRLVVLRYLPYTRRVVQETFGFYPSNYMFWGITNRKWRTLYNSGPHCKEKMPKVWNKYSQKRNILVPQSQFPHSCVCERSIYSHDGSAFSAGGNMWTDPGNIYIAMNVEIWAEAALFPEKEYINGIAVAVQSFNWIPTLLWAFSISGCKEISGNHSCQKRAPESNFNAKGWVWRRSTQQV